MKSERPHIAVIAGKNARGRRTRLQIRQPYWGARQNAGMQRQQLAPSTSQTPDASPKHIDQQERQCQRSPVDRVLRCTRRKRAGDARPKRRRSPEGVFRPELRIQQARSHHLGGGQLRRSPACQQPSPKRLAWSDALRWIRCRRLCPWSAELWWIHCLCTYESALSPCPPIPSAKNTAHAKRLIAWAVARNSHYIRRRKPHRIQRVPYAITSLPS